jgi:hypothetical protein
MEESSGKWQVLGFAGCSGFGACAHLARLVREDVAAGELHVAAVDVEAAALPEEWRSHLEVQGKCFHRGAIGAMEEASRKCQVLGFSSVLGVSCAHVARLVRVDVAVGELHVSVVDAEAAALPNEGRCSLSEGAWKAPCSSRCCSW